MDLTSFDKANLHELSANLRRCLANGTRLEDVIELYVEKFVDSRAAAFTMVIALLPELRERLIELADRIDWNQPQGGN